jgi:NADH-quinone oxidoreductase subunit G
LRIKKAMKAGASIYIVNSQATELDRFAAARITIPVYGAGIAARLLLKYAQQHEAVQTDGFEDISAKTQREEGVLNAAESSFGLELTAQLQLLANEIVGAKGAIILYDEMATLDPGCEDLAGDLQALAVLTKNIGRPGAGVGPLFEDANSLGARDMGVLPDALPGYQPTTEIGMPYAEILTNPQIKALYVMGANPVRHLADKELSAALEFLIVQDIILTDTAKQADVVLPAVTFAEKDGSMTNVDHHVQAIRRALRPLPGAKADWEILAGVARYLGARWDYAKPQDILLEIAENNPFYTGLTWEDLGQQGVRNIEEQEVARA